MFNRYTLVRLTLVVTIIMICEEPILGAPSSEVEQRARRTLGKLFESMQTYDVDAIHRICTPAGALSLSYSINARDDKAGNMINVEHGFRTFGSKWATVDPIWSDEFVVPTLLIVDGKDLVRVIFQKTADKVSFVQRFAAPRAALRGHGAVPRILKPTESRPAAEVENVWKPFIEMLQSGDIHHVADGCTDVGVLSLGFSISDGGQRDIWGILISRGDFLESLPVQLTDATDGVISFAVAKGSMIESTYSFRKSDRTWKFDTVASD